MWNFESGRSPGRKVHFSSFFDLQTESNIILKFVLSFYETGQDPSI